MHGAMLCDFPHSALALYLSEMWHGQTRSYPLAPWLLLPLGLCLALLARALTSYNAQKRGECQVVQRGRARGRGGGRE